HVGSWNGTTQDSLADWRAALNADANAVGKDAHSLEADPRFIDPNGADNVLGYVGGVNGGRDDNFYLNKTSPAIDRGDSWFDTPTDFEGFGRHDDVGTANNGRLDYAESGQGASSFPLTDTDRNFNRDDQSFQLALGFTFPFY